MTSYSHTIVLSDPELSALEQVFQAYRRAVEAGLIPSTPSQQHRLETHMQAILSRSLDNTTLASWSTFCSPQGPPKNFF